jgi:hypothetical protein
MSFAEILVVAIIAVIILKPEDISLLLKSCIKFKHYFFGIKKDMEAKLRAELELEGITEDLASEIEIMNKYLEKIISKEGKYEGDYNLDAIRNHYHESNSSKNISQ